MVFFENIESPSRPKYLEYGQMSLALCITSNSMGHPYTVFRENLQRLRSSEAVAGDVVVVSREVQSEALDMDRGKVMRCRECPAPSSWSS